MSETKDDSGHKHLPGESPLFKVVSHSSLIYWWPVWSLGFIMVVISIANGGRLAIMPASTSVKSVVNGQGFESFNVALSGKPTQSLLNAAAAETGAQAFPYHIEPNTTFHLVYAIMVLVVILATSVTLRGLWSVVNVMALLMLALVFSVFGWWGAIGRELSGLHLYVSAAAYLFASIFLFLYWLAVVLVFDQRQFIIFSPGQIIVHREIGDRQSVYDTSGVTVVKRRNDFIRHRLLGLGSGDLIVSTSDGRHEFELPNVLFADAKVREIAEAMKTRPVMAD
jgi:hypothetical protein